MSLIVKAGKMGKRVLKKFLPEEKHHVSYTRRIERVHTKERVVAMTFSPDSRRPVHTAVESSAFIASL